MAKQHVPPELYLNRELGQLEFNRRVLALAEDRSVPRARAPAFPVHRRQQSRRILRDPGRGPQGRNRSRRAPPVPTACGARAVFRQVTREAQELVARSTGAQRGSVARSSQPRASAFCAAASGIRGPDRPSGSKEYFLSRSDAGPDADRARPGTPVPTRAQQEPQFRGRARRQGCVRPQVRHGDRAGAARAAARDPRCRAQSPGGAHDFVFLSSILHAHVASCFPAWRCSAAISSSSRATASSMSTRRRCEDLRKALQRRAAAAPIRRQRAPGGRRQLLAAHQRCAAAAVRPHARRSLSGQGPVNLVRLMQRAGAGGPARSQVPAVQPGVPGTGEARARHVRRDPQRRHSPAPAVPVVPAGREFSQAGGATIPTWSRSSRPCIAPARNRK